jgi:phage terminase large subunit-like protein
MLPAMADSLITRARRRKARLSAQRVNSRGPAEAAPSEHVLRAREDFAYFCTAMGRPPAEHMKVWHRELITGQSSSKLLDLSGPDTCLLSPRGPLDLNTPVLTPQGWTPLGKIRRGDTVCDSLGRWTAVAAVAHYGSAQTWEVVLSDGTSLVCDDGHDWLVASVTDRQGRWRRVRLSEIRATARVQELTPDGTRRLVRRAALEGEKPWLTPRGGPRWRVPVPAPISKETFPTPIDPYLMGVLLGRGSLSGSAIRVTTDDEDVLERLRSCLPQGCAMRRVVAGTVVWSIVSDGEKPEDGRRPLSRNPLLPHLEAMDLWGSRVWERKLPGIFLRGSISQRVELLQGLSDTLAHTQSGGRVRYVVRSEALADGILSLVRSLGAVATARSTGRAGRRDSWLVDAAFPPEIEPFHSAARASRHRRLAPVRARNFPSRTIVDIRPAGIRGIGCITVESPLHDFVVKDYVVSCNSAKSTVVGLLCAWTLGRHTLARMLLRILYVSFNVEVARGKSMAIKNTIKSLEYQEIFPTVRLSKERTSDELWCLDYDYAGIDVRGEDAFALACAGLQGTITSKRSNLVILDDLIKSAKAIENPDVRREMEQNWSSVIYPTRFEGARAIALGTRFHFDDMFATTFCSDKGWNAVTQEALVYDDDGTPRSYWPEMWSLAYLLERQQADPINFAYQYQNQALRGNRAAMLPIMMVKGAIPDTFDEIGVAMDLASGKKQRNDYTVFMLGGRVDDKAYIIDYRRMKMVGNIEKLQALCELLHDWNLLSLDDLGRFQPTFSQVSVWAESVSYQNSFQGDFEQLVYGEWGLTNLTVSPVTGLKGDKIARFQGVIGLFETDRVVFNQYRDFQVVFDEVLNMGHTTHDDCTDALEILLTRLLRRRQVEVEWE